MEKLEICGFLKPMFSLSRETCLLFKTSKIVFTGSIFTIYYLEIQGVRRGYRGLQGVSEGYRRLVFLTGTSPMKLNKSLILGETMV